MPVKVRRNGPMLLWQGLYVVKYFDRFWNELEHLRLDHAGPIEVQNAVETFLKERDLIRARKVSSSPLCEAENISIARYDEED